MIANKTIPLMTPYVTEAAVCAAADVLRSRWIGQGPRVEEFEQRFSEQIVGGRSCVAVGSGTDALHLAYILAEIGPGDEVIAPLFTCTLATEPLLWMGARIRFCDVAPGSLNMDPGHALRLITERTKAIVVVHYGGQPVDDRLFQLGVPVIEDCAHAVGCPDVALHGDFACYSFQAVKHISTPDGGMLVVPEYLKAKAKRLRWAGIDREAKHNGTWENDITELGYKYQMNDVAAAMGLEGLKVLDWQLCHRRGMRAVYSRGLAAAEGIRMLDADPRSACWLMTVLADRREDLRRKLLENGIESDQVHYRNDRYTIFREFRVPGGFPNMDAIEGKYLVLPMHMGMDLGDVERICEVIRGGW